MLCRNKNWELWSRRSTCIADRGPTQEIFGHRTVPPPWDHIFPVHYPQLQLHFPGLKLSLRVEVEHQEPLKKSSKSNTTYPYKKHYILLWMDVATFAAQFEPIIQYSTIWCYYQKMNQLVYYKVKEYLRIISLFSSLNGVLRNLTNEKNIIQIKSTKNS